MRCMPLFRVIAPLGSHVFENIKDLKLILTSQNLFFLIHHVCRCMYPDFVACFQQSYRSVCTRLSYQVCYEKTLNILVRSGPKLSANIINQLQTKGQSRRLTDSMTFATMWHTLCKDEYVHPTLLLTKR